MQQKVEPAYNPRRLIRKVMMGLDQEAFKDRTTWLCSACDLCYPACPQKVHISEVIAAVKTLAIEAGHTPQFKTAVVNEQTCVACGLCVAVCPYKAVKLQEIPMGPHRTKPVARVDANRCMACGLCAASCRSTSIGLTEPYSAENRMTWQRAEEFSNESLIEQLWGWAQGQVSEGEP